MILLKAISANIKAMKLEICLAIIIYVLGIIVGLLMEVSKNEINFISNSASAFDILKNNLQACGILFTGIFLLGISTLISLLMNGVLLGSTLKASSFYLSTFELFSRGVPHGILELPGIILMGAVGFQTLRIIIDLIKGKKLLIKKELYKTLTLSILSIFCVFIAALIEGYITVLFI